MIMEKVVDYIDKSIKLACSKNKDLRTIQRYISMKYKTFVDLESLKQRKLKLYD
jgi:hypothetical protein